MTGTTAVEIAPTITLVGADGRVGRAGALVIAAGTEWETIVRDARSLYRWAVRGRERLETDGRVIVYHHTAGGNTNAASQRVELARLAETASQSEWGLPYNFVVMPAPPFRAYYLNDVDSCWPHTYGYNHGTAIAAWGNYSQEHPDPGMVGRMVGLADALASMWGFWVPEIQHRDAAATECPGNHLSPLLPASNRQRGR